MPRYSALARVLLLVAALALLLQVDPAPADPGGIPHVPDEVILKFKANASQNDKDQIRQELGGNNIKGLGRIKAELRKLGNGLTVEEAIARYRGHPKVEYIEPNYLLELDRTPSDPRFPEMWGLRNTGQTGGTPGADISATNAWDVFTGSSDVLIGVIDTGVDYTHPDLAANIFINPGEVAGNGIDDDSNGYIDDVHGWDFVNNDNDPIDDHGHGTHTAGTIGAVGDNLIGVTGVNWNVKILPLKFLSSGGGGTTADAIEAVEYATMMGVRLTSNSWGGGAFSQALQDAIQDAGDQGILFVAASGNAAVNTDFSPHYPSSYPLDNIISVAATDHNDQLAGFSNYGEVTVDIAAPGVDILSTLPGGSYGANSGTSMACPHVSGVLGLVFGRYPNISALDAKALVLNSADPLAGLTGVVLTGARLNAFMTVTDPDSTAPAAVTDLAVSTEGSNWLDVSWTATGDDSTEGRASRYEVRFSTGPITEENFSAAMPAGPPPFPSPAGSPETFRVGGLAFLTTYYVAIRCFDEFGNASPISNVTTGTTLGPPDASVAPAFLTEVLVTGSTSQQGITLSNLGTGTLDYVIPSPRLITQPQIQALFTDLPKGAVDPRIGTPQIEGLGGPDGFGYRWVDSDEGFGPAVSWTDISATGTIAIGSGDDISTGPFPIGFTFSFYGVQYDQFRVCSNGFISFTSASTAFTNQPLPNTGAPANLVAPFWDDLLVSPGDVYYQQIGNRLIVQWENLTHYANGSGPVTFQAILFADGTIEFQYRTFGTIDNSATVGIQNATGTDALQIAFNTDYLHEDMAIRIQAVPPWLTVTPTEGTIFAPGSDDLQVQFDPAGLLGGTYEAEIDILSNDPVKDTLTVPVSLTVIGAPDIAVEPPDHDFGPVFLGGSASITFGINNPGTDSLHVSGIAAADPVFTFDPGPFTVAPRGFRTIEVTFTPAGLQLYTDALVISSDDPDSPMLSIPLSGEGIPAPVIGVDPASLDETLFTGAMLDRTLDISNTGGSDLLFTLDIEPSAGPSAVLPEPVVDPSFQGPSAVWDDAYARALHAGSTAPPPITMALVTLPPVVINDPAGDGGPVDVVAVRGRSTASDLQIQIELSTTIDPYNIGGYLSLDTDQDPATGRRPSYGAPGHDIGVEYECTFFNLEFSTVSLYNRVTGIYLGEFPADVQARSVSFSLPLAVLGADDGAMDLSGVLGTSSGPTDWFPDAGHGSIAAISWLLASPPSGLVPPGGTLPVTLAFDATGLLGGEYGAELRLSNNDPQNPDLVVPVVLTVIGAPDITVADETLDFGTVFTGSSGVRDLVIANIGTDDLVVGAVGIDNPTFTADGSGFALPPGASRILPVTFAPSIAGPHAATLTVQSDDPDTPELTVGLTGAGLDPPDISVSPSSLTEDLFTGETASRSLTVANQGLSDLVVTADLEDVEAAAAPAYVVPPGADPAVDSQGGSSSDPASAPAVESSADPAVLVIQDTAAWGVFMADVLQTQFGIVPTVIGQAAVAGTDFNAYDLVITVGDESSLYYNTLSAQAAKFEAFAALGGVVQYQVATQGSDVQLAAGAFVDYGTFDNQNRVVEPNHPITAGLPEILNGNSANHCTLTNLPPGTLILTETYNTHLPTTVEYAVGSGHVIATGMTWEFLYQNGYNSGPLMINALAYSLSLIGPGWLSVDPIEVTVPAGETRDLVVGFDAAGLFGGGYDADVVLLSNDPDEGEVRIPVHLDVTGAPDLHLSANAFDFGTVLIGTYGEEMLTVTNAGTDDLVVSGVAIGEPQYSVDGAGFLLAPGEERILAVRFTPLTEGPAPGSLTVTSNDPDTPLASVSLSGAGLLPPIIGVDPVTLSAALFTGEADTQRVTLTNSGGSDLVYEVKYEQTGAVAPAMTVEGAVASLVERSGILAGSLGRTVTSAVSGETVELWYTSAADVAAVQSVPGATGTWNVAVLAADVTSSRQDVVNKLAGTGRFATIASINVQVVTPTLEELNAFDAVLVFSDYAYQNAVALGNNLADYVDLGGGVVSALFEVAVSANYPGLTLLGRWQSEAYYVMNRSAHQSGIVRTLGTVHLPAHPTMAGVTTFRGGASYRPTTLSLVPGGNVVAEWNDGIPLVSVRSIGGAHRVDLGFYPPSSDVSLSFWDATTDGALLMANALEWAASGLSWISAQPETGTIPAGGSAEVEVVFDAEGLFGGPYDAEIRFENNDPVTPVATVSAHLDVTGAPDIALSDTDLDFGSHFLGATEDRTLTIRNEGTDDLVVSSISTDDPQYSVDLSGFILHPRETRDVLVTFLPSVVGVSPAVLSVASNDNDTPLATVSLTGEGLIPPVADLSPEELVSDLFTNQMETQEATLANEGGSDLHFDVDARLLAGPPGPPPPALPGPKIAVHVQGHTAKAALICRTADAGGASPTNTPCSAYNAEGITHIGQDVYLVVGNVTDALGVTGLSCGIAYDGTHGQGVDVLAWYFCADGLEFPSDTWPESESGSRITWQTCQARTVDPNGAHGIAGAFYIYAYGQDRFRVTENRTLASGPELAYANCLGAVVNVPVTAAGYVQFSDDGTAPGYNPCREGAPQYLGEALAKGEVDTRIGEPVTQGSGGPDRFGYRWIDSDDPEGPAFDWIDIRTTGSYVPISGDDVISPPLPIDFFFPFYGQQFAQIRVCTNGWISFTSTSTQGSNLPLPAINAPENLLAAFWDDFYVYAGGVYWDSSPDRVVIQYEYAYLSGFKQFEVILTPDGTIRYQYLNLGSLALTGCTVGIQNADRNDGLTIAYNTPYLHDQLAIEIRPYPTWLTVNPVVGTVPAGGSAMLGVTTDATDLFGGTYLAELLVDTNDPVHPRLVLPVTLNVTGAPDLRASPEVLQFGSPYVGSPVQRNLGVTNAGTDLLSVTSITAGLPDYTAAPSAFDLQPGQTQVVTVTFVPAEGERNTTLSLVSNDPDSPQEVPLIGTGVIPPMIAVTPDTVEGAALPGGAKTKTLTVCNTGGSDLTFAIEAPEPPPPPPTFGARVALHSQAHAVKASLVCRDADSGGAAPTNTPCSQFTTQAGLNLGRDVYLVAGQVDSLGLRGLVFGIDYDGIYGQGMDLVAWTYCGDGLQFQSDNWPEPESGNIVTWVTCQDRFVPPDGIHAIVGAFYVYAYSSDTFRITEHMRLVSGPKLSYATCQGVERIISPDLAGSVRFSPGGSQPGYNPCLDVVAEEVVPVWLSVEPEAGVVPAGACMDIAVHMEAAQLPAGDYLETLDVTSNDPARPYLAQPVLFHVGSIAATATEIGPNTLNLGSSGLWVTGYVELPLAYAPQDVLLTTVRLNGVVPADEAFLTIGDFNENGIPDLTLKFEREAVEGVLEEGDHVPVTITGEIEDTTYFTGTKTIRVIRPQLTAPNGGETFLAGTLVRVEWTNPQGWEVTSATLSYSPDNGATWELVAQDITGSELIWRVPDQATEEGRLRVHIYDAAGVLGYDTSDDVFTVSTQVVGAETLIPIVHALLQNAPNPFRGSSRITFDLPEASPVKLVVYDVAGRAVRVLEDRVRPAGRHEVTWDGRDDSGRDLAAGIYFYRIDAGSFTARRSMSLMR